MPVAEALARLEPATPAEPHKLMPPAELDAELEAAEVLQGKLPRHYQPVPSDPPLCPGGEEFERKLQLLKLGYEIGPDGELVPPRMQAE